MKTIFIVNPISGKSDASRFLIPQLIRRCEELGVDYQIERTAAPRHAIALAEQFAQSGQPVRLFACGGDGTLNEVLAGAWKYPNAQVGCVPCGSGNDFIKNFSPVSRFSDIAAQLDGEAMPIDLIQTNYGIAAEICSMGLDAQVANGIPTFRRIPLCGGKAAYHLSILQQLCRPLGREMRIITENRSFQGKYLMVAVCNGNCYGGGFQAAPNAVLDDGMLDVVLVKKVSHLRIAQVIGLYKAGKHFENGKVIPSLRDAIEFVRTKQLQIYAADGKEIVINIDGECRSEAQLTAQVLNKAVKFIVPSGAAVNNTAAKNTEKASNYQRKVQQEDKV